MRVSEQITSYNLKWDSPICQELVREKIYFEESRDIIFSGDSFEVNVPFIYEEGLPYVEFDFKTTPSLKMRIEIDKNPLTIDFIGDSLISLDLSTKLL